MNPEISSPKEKPNISFDFMERNDARCRLRLDKKQPRNNWKRINKNNILCDGPGWKSLAVEICC